jgi:hypothetical protein
MKFIDASTNHFEVSMVINYFRLTYSVTLNAAFPLLAAQAGTTTMMSLASPERGPRKLMDVRKCG